MPTFYRNVNLHGYAGRTCPKGMCIIKHAKYLTRYFERYARDISLPHPELIMRKSGHRESLDM